MFAWLILGLEVPTDSRTSDLKIVRSCDVIVRSCDVIVRSCDVFTSFIIMQ